MPAEEGGPVKKIRITSRSAGLPPFCGRRVRQTKVHGTGLGLAIVKEIVDLHDSEIEVLSEIGRGSNFIINFPIRVSELWQEKQF